VIGAVILAIVLGAVIGLAVLPGGSPRAKDPAAVADAYYAALGKPDAAKAYALLCAQQRHGMSSYADEVRADESSGTGISSWTRAGAPEVRGDQAVVAGRLALDDGTTTPIHLLLLREGGRWGVCTSDLGGILPGPGSGSGDGSGGTPT
jgi:hypothetical protein